MREELLKNYYKKKKFFLLLFVSIFLVLIAFSIFAYKLVDSIYEEHINSKLRSAALNTAFILGDKFFDRAIKKGAISKQEDINNTLKLNKLAKNEGVRYVYSMTEKNGKIYFTSSSALPGESLESYWQYYPEATYNLRHIFDINHSFYEVSSDRWGTFKSILIPLYTKKNTPYIVGADIRINRILETKEKFFKTILFVNLIFVFFMGVFAYKVKKMLDEELKTIDNLQKQLEKEIEEKTKELKKLNETLQKRVEEEVAKNREKDKKLIISSRLSQMGEAIYMITHQWQQPLNSISLMVGYLEILKKENKLTSKDIDECIKGVKERIDYLADTMHNFKKFFAKDKEKEEIFINDLVKEVVKIINDILKHKHIKLELELNSNEKIKVYKNEVMQVMIDLIKNAVDEIEKKGIKNGFVKIITVDKKIIIEDNAGGIPDNIKDKIFDFHFTTKKNGTGLGLYMSKIIIEEHHKGKLEVENTKNGARFIIDFTSTQ